MDLIVPVHLDLLYAQLLLDFIDIVAERHVVLFRQLNASNGIHYIKVGLGDTVGKDGLESIEIDLELVLRFIFGLGGGIFSTELLDSLLSLLLLLHE